MTAYNHDREMERAYNEGRRDWLADKPMPDHMDLWTPDERISYRAGYWAEIDDARGEA